MLRYLATAAVIAAGIGCAVSTRQDGSPPAAADTVDAVMIDLPASDAPAPTPSDAADGSAEPAAAAAAPPSAAAPMPHEEAIDAPPAPAGEVAAKPADAVQKPQEATAPTIPAVEAAPPASPSPRPLPQDDGDEARPRPSAHAITLWQQALVKRLDGARRHLSERATAAGTATIAFSVGKHGELASARIAASSGSRALDGIALQLVRRAAPFLAPPAGSRDDELSFTVPVRFR